MLNKLLTYNEQCLYFYIIKKLLVRTDCTISIIALLSSYRLVASDVPYLFVSNTTKESKSSLISRLARAGLSANRNQVYTSLTATHDYLKNNDLRPHCLLSNDALTDFSDIEKEDPNCVVIGLAPPEKFSYVELNKAFQ